MSEYDPEIDLDLDDPWPDDYCCACDGYCVDEEEEDDSDSEPGDEPFTERGSCSS